MQVTITDFIDNKHQSHQSVKYRGKFINPNPTAENRYIHILICSKCALNHSKDLIEEEL